MKLCPAGIHPVQHLGPVLGLGAAGAGVNGKNHIGAVVLPRQQGGQTGVLHLGLQQSEALLQLRDQGFVFKFVAHLAQGHQVVPLALTLGLSIHLGLEVLDTLLNLLRFGQVIPEPVRGGLRLQHIQFTGSALQVQRLGQLLQGGSDVVQLDFIFVELEHIQSSLF